MAVLETFALEGRKVLVTGGAAGYGTCISQGLAEAGATTIIASRSEEKRRKVVDSLKAAGYDAHSYYLDQGDEESINKLHEQLTERFGPLDILVNNAVLRPMKGYRGPLDQWRESLEVNATGMFHLTRLFAEDMIKQNKGSIINISSIYGMVGPSFSQYEGMGPAWLDQPPDYYFHKAGMINLTRFLAAELGKHNIRVNTISPGGLMSDQSEPFLSRYGKNTFLGRMANPDDIKGAIVFLASDASAYVTGINLPVDAGFTAH
ncbi:MAG: SDR family oxidoreductase [Actinobacteria bacterium]|nr:SDR family oxidoreductase [Actinomycetota bacterium]